MKKKQQIKIGIVGVCARGGHFRAGCEAVGLIIQAVCDINEKELNSAAEILGAKEQYIDYETMLAQAEIDAVIIGTPMQLHVQQSIAALERGIHVLCEVPAGVSIEECRQLVAACEKSDAVYMMAENYTYTKKNILIRELVRQGLFGQPYYAEGEYLHELKEMNEDTPWRRKWQTGVAGVTYGTHSLGPILQWMPGDRVETVSCVDTAARHKDPRGEEYAQMTPVMVCRTAKGAVIKIRVDMLSDRPHSMTNYSLQGINGSYESSRGGSDQDKIWLKELSKDIRWHDTAALMDVDQLAEKYLPEMWRNPSEKAKKAGHGGGDYFEVLDFVRAIRSEAPTPIGIHEAMDMTLPGLVSQQSILQEGKWMNVPDSREWKEGETTKPKQLRMIWPEERLKSVPTWTVPAGYTLRTYQQGDGDNAEYIRVMKLAGFEFWDEKKIEETLRMTVPDGLFFIVHNKTKKIVATAVALHRFHTRAEFGWLAGDPEHKGKGLGYIVSAAVIKCFINAGYKDIFLQTDDFRIPAIRTYLKLGFEPLFFAPDMEPRWEKILNKLNWVSHI